jgi:hypothetical protein
VDVCGLGIDGFIRVFSEGDENKAELDERELLRESYESGFAGGRGAFRLAKKVS